MAVMMEAAYSTQINYIQTYCNNKLPRICKMRIDLILTIKPHIQYIY